MKKTKYVDLLKYYKWINDQMKKCKNIPKIDIIVMGGRKSTYETFERLFKEYIKEYESKTNKIKIR